MIRAALIAVLALALAACIDQKLSLGHHEAPEVGDGDGDGDTPNMDASFIPTSSGGMGGMGGVGGMTGGAPFVPPPDAGPADDAAMELPPPSPCEERIAMTATLSCQLQQGGFGQPGDRPPPPMTTIATLTFEPVQRMGREGFARAGGMLDFEAWNARFTGRIDGELECARGTFMALIFEGQLSMNGMPSGPFYGELNGLWSPNTGAIAGSWWHGPDPFTPLCIGDWTATPL